MRNLSLTAKQRTRTADLLEKAAIAALIAILGAKDPMRWPHLGGGILAMMSAIAAVMVERRPGRRH